MLMAYRYRGGGGRSAMPLPVGRRRSPPRRRRTNARDAGPRPARRKKVRVDFRDTAFWTATRNHRAGRQRAVPVPLPDNLTTWRLTAQGITADTLAGVATSRR